MKKCFAFAVVIGTLGALGFTPAVAQVDRCADVLLNSGQNSETIMKRRYSQELLLYYINKYSYEEVQKNDNISAQYKLAYGSLDRERYNQLKGQITELDIQFRESNFALDHIKNSNDPKVIEEWSNCMMKRSGVAVRFLVDHPTRIDIKIEYFKPNTTGSSSTARLRQPIVLADGVKVLTGSECLAKEYLLTEDGCTISIEVPSAKTEFPVNLMTTEGSDRAYLRPRSLYKMQSMTYVQTIAMEVFSTGTPNIKTPHIRRHEMLPNLISEGWKFVPGSITLRNIKHLGVSGKAPDGHCFTNPNVWLGNRSEAESYAPDVSYIHYSADLRVDRNPGDRPLKCHYYFNAQMNRIIDELAER